MAEHDLLVSTEVQRGHRREPVRVLGRLHSTSENLLLSLCERGAGIVCAPACAVRELLRRGKVAPVLAPTSVGAEIHLVSPLAPRAFIECGGTKR